MRDKDRYFKIFMELFEGLDRLGPGSEESTLQALAQLDLPAASEILDIGCGTGASTLVLATQPGIHVFSVDFHKPFLHHLVQRAQQLCVANRITPLTADMAFLPFAEKSFDIVWSEGAAYTIGFEKAVTKWKHLLKNGGYVAISDMVKFVKSLPEEVETFWKNENLVLSLPEQHLEILCENGFSEVEYFTLPQQCWSNYYTPLQEKIAQMKNRYRNDETASTIFASTLEEMKMIDRWNHVYGYAFFTAKRTG